ncbi:RNA-directed DNA polymerase, eukaryota [Tanacetum coccineum]
MDELIKVGQTMGYNMDGCVKNIEAIIGSQGDSHDSSLFVKDNVTASDSFLAATVLGCANAFNNFITMAGLIDLPLEVYSFTWSHKSASKMSKLNRFLIFEGLLTLFPSISALCLDKHLSDHHPIFLCEMDVDYGPTPFHFFILGFLRKKKLQALKSSIKQWLSEDKQKLNAAKRSIQNHLAVLDKNINQRICNEEMTIEGDENSKFFHGIINKKRSQLDIRGVLVEGDWIVEPSKVKNEFLKHFVNRFAEPATQSITFESQFPKCFSSDQNEDLERNVSYDEIKRAVWDRGTNKSPGPDGFTFEFYRRYWNLIDQDIVSTATHFFDSGSFPPRAWRRRREFQATVSRFLK